MRGTHHQSPARGGQWALATAGGGGAWEWSLLAYVCFKVLVSSAGIAVCLLKGVLPSLWSLGNRAESLSVFLAQGCPRSLSQELERHPKEGSMRLDWQRRAGKATLTSVRKNSQRMERQSTVYKGVLRCVYVRLEAPP